MENGIEMDSSRKLPVPATQATGAGIGPANALWYAIRDLTLDQPKTSMRFSDRLARDHLWTRDYAIRVIREYRRFLYLLATESETMAPSEDVDEVWHLHLAYTKSYWDDLCVKVVKRPLHHIPSNGSEDAPRLSLAYERTLGRYRAVFGSDPPADIWPRGYSSLDASGGFRTVPLRDFRLVGRLTSSGVAKVHRLLVAGLFFGLIVAVGMYDQITPQLFAACSIVLGLLGFYSLHLLDDVSLPGWGNEATGYAKYRDDPQSGPGGCGG
jgi:hypothetical protein